MNEQSECPQCSGPGELLGTLCDLVHLRCRNCGWTYHEPKDGPALPRLTLTLGGYLLREGGETVLGVYKQPIHFPEVEDARAFCEENGYQLVIDRPDNVPAH